MRTLILLSPCILLGVGLVSCAQESTKSEFKSEAVRSELQTYLRLTDEASKAYAVELSDLITKHNSEMSKLKDEHLSRMEILLKETTQAADLDEAIKIRDAIAKCRASKIELPDFREKAELFASKITDLEKQIAELTRGKSEKASSKARLTIVGTWRWFSGSDALFHSNGTAEGNVNLAFKLPGPIMNGIWKSTDNHNQFLVTWSNGSIDTLTMSEDGKLLEGRASIDGGRVWAVRLK